MNRTFKYRLYPTPNQSRELDTMLETCRRIYNMWLDTKNLAWTCYREPVTLYEMQKWFTIARKRNTFFACLPIWAARGTMTKLDRTFKAFFRRVKAGDNPGYPRFKSKDRFHSIEFSDMGGIKLTGARLYIQHVGTIRVKLHRPTHGEIKTATLKRLAGKWYVSFCCELPDVPVGESGAPPIGVDVGLESFLTTSEGEHVANPRFLKSELPELRRRSRSLSRKRKGGTNRRKAVRKVAKLHARIANLRREHHHQTSLKLVRRYGLIAVECLDIKGMIRNRRFSRAIRDAGWAGFVSILKCKAESAGVRIVEVDPRGTSQECSACGGVVKKDLKTRWHECECGCSLHRDENAARNILRRALPARIGPAGVKLDDSPVRPKSPATG